ncbi:MAG: hypothetical protein RR198_02205 [Oscillospiraceae bacterium]
MSADRFVQNRKKKYKGIIGIVVGIVIIIALLQGVSSIETQSTKMKKQSLEDAIMKSVTHCYATQGFYPDNLKYIKENYGITYDDEKFVVMYNSFAGNICPDITVIEKK